MQRQTDSIQPDSILTHSQLLQTRTVDSERQRSFANTGRQTHMPHNPHYEEQSPQMHPERRQRETVRDKVRQGRTERDKGRKGEGHARLFVSAPRITAVILVLPIRHSPPAGASSVWCARDFSSRQTK